MQTLWTLAAQCPRVVLEANFRPQSAYERGRVAALGGRVVEVRCRCPAEECRRRYAARARHPAHVLPTLAPEALAEYEGDMGAGLVFDVDTARPVDLARVVGEVRRLLRDPGPRA